MTSFDGGAKFQGFSPDEKLLLFASNISNVWRHSFTAVYTVYNPETNSSFIVKDKENSETLQYLRKILRPSLEEFNLKTGMNIKLS